MNTPTYLYIVTYLDAYGLHEHARVYAKNPSEAKRKVKGGVGNNITIVEVEKQPN